MRLSLNHPVRLFVDSNTDVADNLRQEFVRIKTKKEGDREAIVTGMIISVLLLKNNNYLCSEANGNIWHKANA